MSKQVEIQVQLKVRDDGTIVIASDSGFSFSVAVGFEAPVGDVQAMSWGIVATATDFEKLGLQEGQWIWVGGAADPDKEAPIHRFDSGANGWAQVAEVMPHVLFLRRMAMPQVVDPAPGKRIRMYFGKHIGPMHDDEFGQVVDKAIVDLDGP